jgi:hypothetical protein
MLSGKSLRKSQREYRTDGDCSSRDNVLKLGCRLNWLGIVTDRISRAAPSVSAIVVYCYLVESLTLRLCPSSTRRRVFRQRDTFDECNSKQHYLPEDYNLGNYCGENL